MKHLIFLFTAFVVMSCTQNKPLKHLASKLDTIENYAEIEHLIQVCDTNYSPFKLRPFTEYNGIFQHKGDSIIRQAAKDFKLTKPFYKADFDQNGYTDILVTGDMHWCNNDTVFCRATSLILMNFGKDSLKLCPLTSEVFYPFPVLPQLVFHNGLPLITAHQFNSAGKDKLALLTYKNRGFVEYTKKQTSHNIEHIRFISGPCMGTCPVFEISIKKDRSAWFLAQSYNFSDTIDEERYFIGSINQNKF